MGYIIRTDVPEQEVRRTASEVMGCTRPSDEYLSHLNTSMGDYYNTLPTVVADRVRYAYNVTFDPNAITTASHIASGMLSGEPLQGERIVEYYPPDELYRLHPIAQEYIMAHPSLYNNDGIYRFDDTYVDPEPYVPDVYITNRYMELYDGRPEYDPQTGENIVTIYSYDKTDSHRLTNDEILDILLMHDEIDDALASGYDPTNPYDDVC